MTEQTTMTPEEIALRPSLSIHKVMALVGVSRRTVYNWLSAGKVEYVRTPGGSVRIFTDSVWKTGNITVSTDEQPEQKIETP